MMNHPALICSICAGFHHPDQCERALRFIAECRGLITYTSLPSADDLKRSLFMERRQQQLDLEAGRVARVNQASTDRNRAMRARRARMSS